MIIPEEIKQKPVEYLALLLLLSIFATVFFYFSYDHYYQKIILYLISAVYLIWSVYHHSKRSDLHLSIIFEYLIFAALGVIIINSILK